MKMNKKAAIMDELMGLIIAIVVIAIVLVVGFLIISATKTQIQSVEGLGTEGQNAANPNGTTAWNSTIKVQSAIGTIPAWLPIIIITIIGAGLIGLVSIFRGKR